MTLDRYTPAQAAVTYTYGEHAFQVHMIDDEPWFPANEVCAAIGLSNVGQALASLDDDEKDHIITNDAFRRGPRTRAIVSESGLYSLILRSRKPEAKMFKRWITREVLPSIRKAGGYVAPSADLEKIGDAKLFQIAFERSEALRREQQCLLVEAREQVQELAPYREAIETGNGRYLVREAAKHIESTLGIKLTQKTLFDDLKSEKSPKGLGWVTRFGSDPYQRIIDRGLMGTKPVKIETEDGRIKHRTTPYITSKGLAALIEHYGQQTQGQLEVWGS